jgi:DNA-binding CsgD family transcriptional regulator
VDSAERREILRRYADHAQRFDATAARRFGRGAQIIPLPRLPDTEQDLSPRELQVLQLISEGLTNTEIARVLSVSGETIKSHVRHLLAKLQARSRAHAITIGFRRDILH